MTRASWDREGRIIDMVRRYNKRMRGEQTGHDHSGPRIKLGEAHDMVLSLKEAFLFCEEDESYSEEVISRCLLSFAVEIVEAVNNAMDPKQRVRVMRRIRENWETG